MYNFRVYDPAFLPHRGCDLELGVAPGGALVLCGENGLGKSTLLRRLAQQHDRVSLLQQFPLEHFFDRSLGRFYQILEEVRILDPLPLERLWRSFRLHEREQHRLSQLSGGEAQALKLVLALAARADLFLLDEPTQYLDEAARRVLLEKLRALRAAGKALVIVEHDLSWADPEWRVQRLVDRAGTLTTETPWTI